ncbi:DUF2066 domain-containing protein [Pseudoxanthomonas sp. KAs_5_3]|nr:DUF2066 domain-containing protein [Pseudoxanthomonas sp. KAs_5_3]SFV35209.1 hypothetical protein SAMN05428990_2984 [Pseudoxanthomonas sp. YR558]
MRRISGFALAAAMLLAVLTTTPQVQAQSGLRTEGDAVSARGLYQAEVPVNGQGEAERQGGFARALGSVLGKLSGDRGVMSRPGVGAELRNAKDYVEGYDYRQDQGTSASGAPTFRTTLVVRFDEDQVNGLAGALGLPIWPQPRPKPVVWLAINDGSGPRLVGLPQSNAARPLLNRAVERGYSLGLPGGGAAEQALVGAIWRQDTAAVARASSRYSPPMQLIGKLYRDKSGWTADWVFVDAGKVLAKWSVTDADARRAMSSGADGTADALVKRYGKRGTAGPAGTYRVLFTGVRSTDDYLRLTGHLQKMAVVRRITPVRASGDTLELDLELVSGLAGFRRTMGDQAPFTGGEGEPPAFQMR